MYNIFFTKKATKTIKSLAKGNRNRLKEILNFRVSSPFHYPYKKIQGETNTYRIRLGTYRILYEVREANKESIILNIDVQGKIY